MIVRGTTPYHSFLLPILAEEIKTVWITYCQNEDIIFEKNGTDDGVTITNLLDLYENASMGEELDEELQGYSQLTIHLTQEDTLKFKFYPAAKKNIAVIEMRLLATDDEAYAIEPIRERIFGVRHEGVIGNEPNESEEVNTND